MRNRRMRWVAGLLGSTLVGVAAVGCGGSEPGPQVAAEGGSSFRRLELETTGSTGGAAKPLARLVAEKENLPWVGLAREGVDHTRILSPAMKGKGDGRLPATILRGRGEVKYIRGAIPVAAAGFDQVIAEVAAHGGLTEQVSLQVLRDGKNLFAAKVAEIQAVSQTTVVTFSIPELRSVGAPPDEFRLGFAGRSLVGAVASVTFVDLPLDRFLVPEGSGGESRVVGGLYRRSDSITSEAPRTARFDLARGEEIALHLAADPSLLRPNERLTFETVVEGTDGSQRRSTEISKADRWERLTWSAQEVGAGPASLTVTLKSNVTGEAAVGLVAEASVRRRARGAPTVLLITSDTHRADHIGAMNPSSPVDTPHLDALAQRGVLFADCYAQTNVTNPSHISLMTGVHPRDTGILNNRVRLAGSARTIAELFADAGYETFAVTSAFHLLDRHSGLGQGFDRMEGPLRPQRDGEISIERLTKWIDASEGTPLFAWLHLFDAHEPYGPPKPYDGKYYEGTEPFGDGDPGIDSKIIPHWLEGLQDVEYPYAQYRAEVDYLDGALEGLLNHPRIRAGIVAFTADHGESFGEHGIWWDHAGLYPSTTHIPLIMAWPGGPQGVRTDAPVRQIDVSKTLLALAGLDEDDDFAGRDLRWSLETDPIENPRFGLASHQFTATLQSGPWLFVLELGRHFERPLERMRYTGEAELFNLADDPLCENDLLLEEFDQSSRMRERLIEWLNAAEDLGMREDQQRSAEDESMLASLGYGGGEDDDSTSALWNPEKWESKAQWEQDPWRRLFEDETFTVDDFRNAEKR